MSLPLDRFVLCRSRDIGEFGEQLNDAYYPAVVSPRSPAGGPATSLLHAVTGPGFTVGYVRPADEVVVTPRKGSTSYHVNIALSGSVASTCGKREVLVRPGRAAVFTAGEEHVLRRWSAGAEVIGIKLGRALVERELSVMLGRPISGAVRFQPDLDLTSPEGASWLALVRSLTDELNRSGGLLDVPEVRQYYLRSLVAALLHVQRHSWSDELTASSSTPLRPRTVRRALDYMDAHLEGHVMLGDIAAAAGCSERRLQEAFHTHVGTPPGEHLRAMRLDRVRAELTGGTATVTATALRFGFTHLGRFAAAYRDRFDELPSETAARG